LNGSCFKLLKTRQHCPAFEWLGYFGQPSCLKYLKTEPYVFKPLLDHLRTGQIRFSDGDSSLVHIQLFTFLQSGFSSYILDVVVTKLITGKIIQKKATNH
jgi:hypothetical protein